MSVPDTPGRGIDQSRAESRKAGHFGTDIMHLIAHMMKAGASLGEKASYR